MEDCAGGRNLVQKEISALYNLEGKTGRLGHHRNLGFVSMARGLASFFQMIARVGMSQPPNSPLWVQSWILFKDDDKVPPGLSKVLGWREGCVSSLAGNRRVACCATGNHCMQIKENEICNFALIAR